MEDLFRAFFGLNNRHDIYRRKDSTINEEDDDDEDTDNNNDNSAVNKDERAPAADVFMFPLNIDEIMQQFTGAIFPNVTDMIKDMERFQIPEIAPEKGRSLREEMLKEDSLPTGEQQSTEIVTPPFPGHDRKQGSFWDRYIWSRDTPRNKQPVPDSMYRDTDLDHAVRSQGIDSVLHPPTSSLEKADIDGFPAGDVVVKPSRSFFYSFSSSSRSTFNGSDGKVVEKSTTRNIDGDVETVVTRSVDGETVTERVKKDKNGRVLEAVTEKSSSEDLWKRHVIGKEDNLEYGPKWDTRDSGTGKNSHRSPSAVERRDNMDSIFKNIFGFDYPRSDNDG